MVLQKKKVYSNAINKMSNKTQRMYLRSVSETPTSQNDPKKQTSRTNSIHQLDVNQTSSESANALEEVLRCGICHERLFDPRMLPCQHTFCLGCLQTHFKYIISNMVKTPIHDLLEISKTTIVALSCPLCEKVIDLNCRFESLAELPKNIYIDNLLKLMDSSCASPTSLSSPSLRCMKCDTVFQVHGKPCGHCLQVFCSVCWTEHLSTLKSTINTLVQQLSESEDKLQTRINDFNAQCQSVSEEINQATKNLMQKLQDKKTNTLQQLDDIKKNEETNVQELKNRVKNISAQLNGLNFDTIGNEEEKVNTFMNYHRETSKILDDVSQWGEIQVFFNKNTFSVTHSNQIYSDDNGSCALIENPFDSIDSMSTHYREKSFKPTLVWNKCPRPAGLGIPPWAPHHLYIATTNRKVVLIMDRSTSKVISKLSSPEMYWPQSIAFSKVLREVYITDKLKHCIHVFNPEGEYLRTLSNLGEGKGELKSPEGIAVTNNNNLVVCDSGNDRVVVLNPENGELIFLLAGSTHRTPFQEPTGVAVFEDKIIVSDTGNHTIKIYSTAGNALLEFGTVGSGKGQFRRAEVVTCDIMGFIFVGDSGNGRIQIFTPHGKFVRELNIQRKNSRKALWVSGLAVSTQLELMISDHKEMCLQIFNRYSNT